MVRTVAVNAEQAYRRTHPQQALRRLKSEGGETSPSMRPKTVRCLSLPVDDIVDQQDIDDSSSNGSDDPHLFFGADHGSIFSPTAASADRTTRASSIVDDAVSLELGNLGAAGGGLFIVLFADDVHSTTELLDGLREFFGANIVYTETLLGKLVRALRLYGHLVVRHVYGTEALAVLNVSLLTFIQLMVWYPDLGHS
jgi:hypothetical protein